jgi:hypothetical protein
MEESRKVEVYSNKLQQMIEVEIVNSPGNNEINSRMLVVDEEE